MLYSKSVMGGGGDQVKHVCRVLGEVRRFCFQIKQSIISKVSKVIVLMQKNNACGQVLLYTLFVDRVLLLVEFIPVVSSLEFGSHINLK